MTAVWAARHLRMTRRRRLDRLVQSRIDGQRHAAGDRRAAGFSQSSGDFHERRRRIHHADGRPADAGAVRTSDQAHRLQQQHAGHGQTGNACGGLPRISAWMSNIRTLQRWRRPLGFAEFASRIPETSRSPWPPPFGTTAPCFIDVVTNPNALALPPKIDAKEIAGYGLYVAKQTLHGRLFESIDELKGNLP